MVINYGVNHLSSFNENTFNLDKNYKDMIPNINSCNFDYLNIYQHLDNGNFTKTRYRKIITEDESCFGKILYTGVIPGEKFSNLKKNDYLEFGVGQKLGLVLWLFEPISITFLVCIASILFLQILNKKKSLFLYVILIFIIFSTYTFNSYNMYLNSTKKYFPNSNSTNEQIFNELMINND